MGNCELCQCLGIIRVVNKDQEMDSLAYCDCSWSKRGGQVWKLPTVNKKIMDAFTIGPCPLVWFFPDNERESVPRGWLVSSIDDKVIEWSARMSEAQKFWEDWGNIFSETKKHWSDR